MTAAAEERSTRDIAIATQVLLNEHIASERVDHDRMQAMLARQDAERASFHAETTARVEANHRENQSAIAAVRTELNGGLERLGATVTRLATRQETDDALRSSEREGDRRRFERRNIMHAALIGLAAALIGGALAGGAGMLMTWLHGGAG